MITQIEYKTIEKSLIECKNESQLVIHNPLLKYLFYKYSRWSFEQMLFQFMNSHSLIVKTVTADSQRKK